MTDLERAWGIVEDLENAYPTLPWETVVKTIAAALAAVREEDAQAVNGLIGKDSGNWNRAIAYAVEVIRAKGRESQDEAMFVRAMKIYPTTLEHHERRAKSKKEKRP